MEGWIREFKATSAIISLFTSDLKKKNIKLCAKVEKLSFFWTINLREHAGEIEISNQKISKSKRPMSF